MMRKLLMLLALLGLSACAFSGNIYDESQQVSKPIPAGKARLFVYREWSLFGTGVRPSIFLDGKKIRRSVPNSFTMIDITPGNRVLTNVGEVEKRLDFTAVANQTIYVREEPMLGIWGRIGFLLVDSATAQKEMKTLREQNFVPEAK
ncbi:MAG: DUF2846 domain-containing protein [Rickettsiales bacterium]|jgi:hypothetical protein|nr:DUF2846 domain-containing protein [Rickettsiales bacterium]